MKNILRSRKFYAALIALAFAFFGDRAGIDAATLQNAVITLVAYILGTGLEDGLSKMTR